MSCVYTLHPSHPPGPELALCRGWHKSLKGLGSRPASLGRGAATQGTCSESHVRSEPGPSLGHLHTRLLPALPAWQSGLPGDRPGRGSQGWVLRELFKAISWAGKRKMLIKCPGEAWDQIVLEPSHAASAHRCRGSQSVSWPGDLSLESLPRGEGPRRILRLAVPTSAPEAPYNAHLPQLAGDF